MSSLVCIDNDNSNLIYDINDIYKILDYDTNSNIKVISVIGKARTGKSTLLNTIISKITNDDTTIFKTSDETTHCTNGVDFHLIGNLLFLDFQGIYLGDSSMDSKLLLLSYLISDVIIFNENKILSNNTLSQFEPMVAFMHYINKIKTKNPKLIFRISDVNLNIEPTTNMHQMLTKQKDQFQSIRECIEELFDEPFAISTNSLDRHEFKLLKKQQYLDILNESDNGFDTAITKIMEYIECTESKTNFGSFLSNIKNIIDILNSNKKVDFKKLDVVLNLANYEILDYIHKINNSVYDEIEVDGTEETYQKNLVSRMNKKEEILADIYKTFSTIPKNIIDVQIDKNFSNKIDPVINNAKEKNLKLAYEKYNEYLNELVPKILFSFVFGVDEYNELKENIKNRFNIVDEKISHLYSVVYNEFIDRTKVICESIKNAYKEQMKIIDKSIENMDKLSKNYVDNIQDNIEKIFLEYFNEYELEPHIKIQTYFNEFCEEKMSALKSIIFDDISDKTYKMYIEIDFYNLDDVKIKIDEIDESSTYYINIFEIYEQRLNNILKDNKKNMIEIATKIREDYLTTVGVLNDDEFNIDKTILNNRDIIFVKFKPLQTYTMTYKYFEKTLKLDIENVCNNCNKEGYIYDWNQFRKDIVEETSENVFTINFNKYKEITKDDYEKTVYLEMFLLEFKKYYARKQLTFKF